MSKRAWYRCNERKAQALFEQGIKVRYERGAWYYKRPPRKGGDRERKKVRPDARDTPTATP